MEMNKTREELLRTLVVRLGSVMRGMHAGQGFRFAGFTVGPPGVSVKVLAVVLSVTPGAVTQFIDALVEKALVSREEDHIDRRLLRIKLTKFAKDKFTEFKRDYFAAVSRVFDSLSDEDVMQLTGLLMKANVPSNLKEPNK
jgi:DNA-binding MarR family transcriptional regulator